MRFIFSRVWGKETQPCWNKPHFFKAGYGFQKKVALFQPGGVGERSTAALEKAACFQSRNGQSRSPVLVHGRCEVFTTALGDVYSSLL